MRQLFKIDESEKKRILEMHENATKKNYLGEQTTQQPTPQQPQATVKIDGKPYKLPGIVDKASLESFIGDEEFSPGELTQLNDFLKTEMQMFARDSMGRDGMSSGDGGKALSAVRNSLDFLAQRVSSKENICMAKYTLDNFSSIPDMKKISDSYADLTKGKTLADFVNYKIKTSQYCKR